MELLEAPSAENDGAVSRGDGEDGTVDGSRRDQGWELIDEFVARSWDADD